MTSKREQYAVIRHISETVEDPFEATRQIRKVLGIPDRELERAAADRAAEELEKALGFGGSNAVVRSSGYHGSSECKLVVWFTRTTSGGIEGKTFFGYPLEETNSNPNWDDD